LGLIYAAPLLINISRYESTMTRAYALLASLLLIATPLAGCTSSPEIEQIVDDILGCMDENAENYDENATAELLGDCIYLASMEAFMAAMTDQMEIDAMLEIIPRAGYSMTISSSEFNTDMNMQMDTVIEEMVMADLDTDSVYVKMGMSIVPLLVYEYTQVQVGELVNVHYNVGGMFAGAGAGMGSYQTRDATPDVMETISSLVSVSDAGEAGGEMGLNLPTGDISDMSSEMPADAEPVITYDDESGVQTMTLEYTNDSGSDISIVILIDDNEDLMSYEISTDNGSATTSISYTVMWGDAVVIEVDDTLPRTSIPINFHIEGMPEDNWDDGDDGDGDDDESPSPEEIEQMMDYMDTDDDGYLSLQELIDYHNNDRDQNGEEPMSSEEEEQTAYWFSSGDTDGDDLLSLDEFTQLLESTGDDDGGDDGNDVYWQSYEGGHCEWEGNDEDGADETVWWCKNSQDDDYWETWWYYCEHHDSDWHCTDDYGQNEGYENSSDGTSYLDTLPPVINGPDPDEDGAPSPEEAMESVDANGDDFMSYQEFQDAWESDPENFELDYDEVTILFDDCDYDDNDLIDIDEMQCFIDGIVDMAPDEGDEDPEQMFGHIDTDDDGYVSLQEIIDFSNNNEEGDDSDDEIDEEELANWFSWCDTDEDDLLNLDEFTTCVEDDDDDEGDGSDEDGSGGDTLPPIITGFIADNQTLNAPITDFEVHFLSDCEEEYDEDEGEMIQPDLSTCTTEFSIPLTGGEVEGVTITYTDHDGDGLVSPGDEMSIERGDYEGDEIDKMEIYDTWASEYSSESAAMPPALPGFGAILGALALLGAAMASRRD